MPVSSFKFQGPILSGVLLVAACQAKVGPEREISGRRLFEQHCARCHGSEGKGAAEVEGVPDLSDPARMSALGDFALRETIRRGRPPRMPAYGETFTDASLMVLVAYVRGFSGTPGDHPRPVEGSPRGP